MKNKKQFLKDIRLLVCDMYNTVHYYLIGTEDMQYSTTTSMKYRTKVTGLQHVIKTSITIYL